jgi:hypothetical protein
VNGDLSLGLTLPLKTSASASPPKFPDKYTMTTACTLSTTCRAMWCLSSLRTRTIFFRPGGRDDGLGEPELEFGQSQVLQIAGGLSVGVLAGSKEA